MKLHEYQAKELLAAAGIPVPEGRVADSVDEAVAAAGELGWPVAVKAQVHAGGRGRAGGIRLASSREEVEAAADAILGMILKTAQSGDRGHRVRRVLVEQGQEIAAEFYLSVLPDRATATLAVIGSRAGGMDIEEVAATSPERIKRVSVDPLLGLQPFQIRQMCFDLELSGDTAREFGRVLTSLFALVVKRDLLLAEINPLALTREDRLLALDAKMEVDPSALFRHPDLAELRDDQDGDPLEAEARRNHLNYIHLDGTVGTMVNGAGLAMATMDLIKRAGHEPANFLDVGGGANADMIEQGFRILIADPGVRTILINIFGGILRCDVLARGVVEAARGVGLDLPVVVRMEGTNAGEGRRILAGSGLDLIPAADLGEVVVRLGELDLASRPGKEEA